MHYNITLEVGVLEPTIVLSITKFNPGFAFPGIGNNREKFDKRLSIVDCEKLIKDLQEQLERAKKVENALK